LELAKIDSDMIQSLHQRELTEICRWLYVLDYTITKTWIKNLLNKFRGDGITNLT
jgi:hypothetical protein